MFCSIFSAFLERNVEQLPCSMFCSIFLAFFERNIEICPLFYVLFYFSRIFRTKHRTAHPVSVKRRESFLINRTKKAPGFGIWRAASFASANCLSCKRIPEFRGLYLRFSDQRTFARNDWSLSFCGLSKISDGVPSSMILPSSMKMTREPTSLANPIS